MIINPEFRRNLWLELSLQRLIAMPVILALLFGLALQLRDGDPRNMVMLAEGLFVLLAMLWGCRRAAASVATEVREGTWDWQRMSALGPWPMAWGKLLGGTAFVWYGALICLAVWIAGQLGRAATDDLLRDAAMMLGAGLLAQAVSFAASLAWLRKTRPTRRLPVTLSQVLGIMVGLQASHSSSNLVSGLPAILTSVPWYGSEFEPGTFLALSVALFLAWGLLASFRLMQAELQVRIWPWAWLAFTLFVMFYLNGLVLGYWMNCDHCGEPGAVLMIVPYGVAFLFFYAALFLEPKDIVRSRNLVAAFAAADWRRLLVMTPTWLPALLLVLITGCLTALAQHVLPAPQLDVLFAFEPPLELPGILAHFGFVLRDLCLVLLLNFGARRRRADLAAFIYLAMLYVLAPWIVSVAGQGWARTLFLPGGPGSAWLNLAAAWMQGLAMLGLLILRWRVLLARFLATTRRAPATAEVVAPDPGLR